MQRLEVVREHSEFLSHFSIPQANPTQRRQRVVELRDGGGRGQEDRAEDRAEEEQAAAAGCAAPLPAPPPMPPPAPPAGRAAPAPPPPPPPRAPRSSTRVATRAASSQPPRASAPARQRPLRLARRVPPLLARPLVLRATSSPHKATSRCFALALWDRAAPAGRPLDAADTRTHRHGSSTGKRETGLS